MNNSEADESEMASAPVSGSAANDAASENTSPDDAAPAAPSGGEATPDGGATPGAPAEPEPAEPLALGFDASFLTQRDPGLLIVSLVVEPDNRSRAVAALLAEVSRVRNNSIDAASLARAKKMLIRQYTQQGETVSGQAGALGFYEMISSYRFAVDYVSLVQQVTAGDIKRVANTYLSPKNHVQITIEPTPRPLPRPFPRNDGDSGGITA
jgi:hypothetical protein